MMALAGCADGQQLCVERSLLSPPCFQEQTSHCRHTLHFIRLTSCEPTGHSNKRNKLESRSFLSGLHVLSGAKGAEESLSVHFDAGQSSMSQTPVNGALTGLLSTESLGLGLSLSRTASIGGLAGHNEDLKTLKSFNPMCIQSDGQYLLPNAAQVLPHTACPKDLSFCPILLLSFLIHRC